MNYLLYGTEKFLINNEIKKIINKYNIEDINISKYDLDINTLGEILDDIKTVSLFSSKKLIIIDNSYIFSRTTKKIDNNIELENYLNNPIKDNIVIFINNLDKIDGVKKIVKVIKEKGIIIEFNKLNNITNNVKKMFDNYIVSNDNINYLINRIGNNIEILYQEIEKIKIYKLDDKVITKDDIDNITSENINIDIFKFIDDIINKNKDCAIKTYKELLKINEEPIKIVALLASKFRLMYQTKILTGDGYNEEEISNLLNIHKYPVHLALTSGYKYSSDLLLNYMLELSNMDTKIKKGESDKNLALELFILKL